jgi:predicted site-specific integrase-resolvase
MKLTIRGAAKELGVSTDTLRRWDKSGKLVADRTVAGHRRYDLDQLLRIQNKKQLPSARITICYARVSTSEQKADLERQVNLLQSFCEAKGWQPQVIQDLGSGLNYNKRGLRELIKLVLAGSVERIVVSHKDRLLRFGAEIIFQICEAFNTQVIIITRNDEKIAFEEELAQDVLEIITVFSAKLYGSRSKKNKIIAEKLKEATYDAN